MTTPSTSLSLLDTVSRIRRFGPNALDPYPPREPSPTNSMKQQKESGERLELHLTVSGAKLCEMDIDVIEGQPEIHITSKAGSDGSYTKSLTFSQPVNAVTITFTPTPSGPMKTDISSSESKPEYRSPNSPEWPLSRHDWGTGE